ncbi:MAG: ATP-binding protein [Sulfuricurvum sp.]|uniref:ATP-binding protein n=1 Tax=Sulfuricurvum sp. TaxID=2025608 RepID=UPI00260431A7|nr:ATP-binding protein [Sulfuricurvum sp.]MDD3595505.1 ATP-binding protein [Sulfuricurvum sp.]
MPDTLKIVYVTDWVIANESLSRQDPFIEVLQNIDADLDVLDRLPEIFEEIDLLILHPMHMKADVFEAISKSKEHNPAIKTVVISSAHGSDLFLKAIDVGVDKYLLKPLLPSAVKKVAERLLQHSLDAKQAQKAFRQINLMFGAISKTSLLIRMEYDGTIIEVNNLLLELLHYHSDEMIGSHWMRFVERRFWLFLRSLVREKLKAGEIYRGTIELLSSNGDSITVDATLYSIRDGRGEIGEIVCIAQDVSEVNRAILASMEQLIDHDTSLAVLFDHRYEAVLVNRKFLLQNGYEESQDFFSAKDVLVWMTESKEETTPVLQGEHTQKDALQAICELYRDEKIQGRIVSTDRNQEKRYYSIHTTSMPNPMIRNEEYHILYFVDITNFERLKEEKLSDAKLMSVGRLAAAITHEINTPITYIKGNLELLKWDCEGKVADADALFESIDEGVKRIESIVNSMYEFAGTGKEVMKACSVHMTLIYALRIIMNRAKHIVPIRINDELFLQTTEYNSTSCMTMGISNRLEQVWIIILNNAMDEFEKGTIPYENRQLDISIQCDEKEIVVKILDNAGGIPQSVLPGIFDFAISGEKKQSMGIGLNVAKAIIDKHGGSIRVVNKDQGAVFEVILKTYEEVK